MRKNIELSVCERDFDLEVDFNFIDIVETSFEENADKIALTLSGGLPKRSIMARVVYNWVRQQHGKQAPGRQEVAKYVYTCPITEYEGFILKCQAALLWTMEYITEKGFDQILAGEVPEFVQREQKGGENDEGKAETPTE